MSRTKDLYKYNVSELWHNLQFPYKYKAPVNSYSEFLSSVISIEKPFNPH